MEDNLKRKAAADANSVGKRQKGPKKWRVVHKGQSNFQSKSAALEVGDAGIWVTCDKGSEGKCIAELRDIFNEYSTKLYGDTTATTKETEHATDEDSANELDIETEISNEIKSMKQSSSTPLFQPVRIDLKCLIFFKTRPPIQPEELVHRICSDAYQGVLPFRGRYIKRLTPVTLFGKATEKGLEGVSAKVLESHFHAEGVGSKKFAIRPSLRSHDTLNRDTVIKQIADAVGSNHSVDLKNYDKCILVEIYKTLCGMAVVGSDYEQLKRFNLAEIWGERKEQGKEKAKAEMDGGKPRPREDDKEADEEAVGGDS